MPDAGQTLEETAVQNAAMQAQKIISLNKFIFLSVISFGLYPIWWMFEAWRFFMQKDRLDIMRVIFPQDSCMEASLSSHCWPGCLTRIGWFQCLPLSS